jgi:Bacterial protein of unknown function (DUF899)
MVSRKERHANSLVPAAQLARRSPVRFPNESVEYRAARTALLAEEIELRRHLERVPAQRRALPPGGEVIGLPVPKRAWPAELRRPVRR